MEVDKITLRPFNERNVCLNSPPRFTLTLEASLWEYGLPPDSDAEATGLPNTTNLIFAASTESHTEIPRRRGNRAWDSPATCTESCPSFTEEECYVRAGVCPLPPTCLLIMWLLIDTHLQWRRRCKDGSDFRAICYPAPSTADGFFWFCSSASSRVVGTCRVPSNVFSLTSHNVAGHRIFSDISDPFSISVMTVFFVLFFCHFGKQPHFKVKQQQECLCCLRGGCCHQTLHAQLSGVRFTPIIQDFWSAEEHKRDRTLHSSVGSDAKNKHEPADLLLTSASSFLFAKEAVYEHILSSWCQEQNMFMSLNILISSWFKTSSFSTKLRRL